MTRISLRFGISQFPSQGLGMSSGSASEHSSLRMVLIRPERSEGLVGGPGGGEGLVRGPDGGPPGLDGELCCTACNPPHTLQPSTTAGLQTQLLTSKQQTYQRLMSVSLQIAHFCFYPEVLFGPDFMNKLLSRRFLWQQGEQEKGRGVKQLVNT